jgi:hypothetical protein
MPIFSGATPPSADEIEVTVLGPGFGECVVVHLGHDDWMIVDSCRDPEHASPAARVYLDTIGVAPERVRYILVSHWHDDHTRGVSELAKHYQHARIGVSNVLNTKEGKTFLAAYSGRVSELSRGTVELYTIFATNKGRLEPLGQNRVAFSRPGQVPVTVTALSPTDDFYFESRAVLEAMIPKRNASSSQKEAPQMSPNNEAVVVHVTVGETGILLGSDLETNQHGWSVVASNPQLACLPKAELYKVAHHGSLSAECQSVWDNLLAPKPLSVLTPFHHGRHRLPNPSDRDRILANSKTAHISSQASARTKVDPRIVRRLEAMGSKPMPLHAGFGAVRSRKAITAGATEWNVSHFGAAGPLQRM